MRLVNRTTSETLVEFLPGEVRFYNPLLEKEMKTLGIPIPHGMRSLFDGKDTVFLGDDAFERAFREVYYLTYVETAQFQWEK